jgi:hypothetical protein
VKNFISNFLPFSFPFDLGSCTLETNRKASIMGVSKTAQAEVKKMLAASKAAAKAQTSAKHGSKKAAVPEIPSKDLHKKLRAMVTAAEVGARPATQEPPFTYEVHGRRQTITVEVTLHKIPPQFINIDETTDKMLVVDTTKFTKKWRLEFPFPSKMIVDAENGDYTFENGILKCVFAVKHMPKEIETKTQEIVESVRQGRKLRFRYDQQGELQIRSRKTNIELPGEGKKGSRKREREDDGDDGDAEEKGKEATKKGTKKGDQKNGNNNKNEKAKPSQSNNANKQFVSDDATASIAVEAGKSAATEINKKKAELKEKEASFSKRDDSREDRKAQKTEKVQMSFQALVAEKKRLLAERLALAAAPVRAPNPNAKAVKFAA